MTETANILKAERGDGIGPIRFMAAAEGYVMVRRPGASPWVETVTEWVRRPLETTASVDRKTYRHQKNLERERAQTVKW